jgi:two-component system chemotaxis response regulator CheY
MSGGGNVASILIVDDSKFMRKMLGDILVEDGHQIVGEAENAREAVELYRRLKPDLVTLDIIMPKVGETDAISALKEMIRINPLAKVVVISAMGQQDIVREYIKAGARNFIVKPFQTSNVTGVVKEVLEDF